jgi:signal transduction histidine kinase
MSIVFASGQKGINLGDYYVDEDIGHVITIEDIDGDGDDEITRFNYESNSILIYSLTEGQCSDIYLSKKVIFYDLKYSDILPDPDDELIVGCSTKDGYVYYIFANVLRVYGFKAIKDSLFFENGIDNVSPEGWDGYYSFDIAQDINRDYRPELVFSVNAGWDKYPREMFAYDLFNRKKIWSYTSANTLHLIDTVDVDGDNNPEFILGGKGPGNDAVKGPETDDRVRLFIVDSDGNEVWKYSFGKGSRDIDAAYYHNNPGSKKLLYCSVSYIYRENIEKDKTREVELYLIDIQNKIVEKKHGYDGSRGYILFYDSPDPAKTRLFVSTADGTIGLYNKDLKLLREHKTLSSISCTGVLDIDTDGYGEYLVMTNTPEVNIYNDLLESTAYYKEGCFSSREPANLLAIIDHNHPEYLCLNGINEVGKKVYRLFKVPDLRPLKWYDYYRWWIMRNRLPIIMFTVVFSITMFLVYFIFRYYRSVLLNNRLQNETNMGILHVKKGNLAGYNKTSARIMGLDLSSFKRRPFSRLANQDSSSSLNEYVEGIKDTGDVRKSCLKVRIDNKDKELEVFSIVRKSRRDIPIEYLLVLAENRLDQQEWFTLASGIAHDIKNPCGLAYTQLANLISKIDSGLKLDQTSVSTNIKGTISNINRAIDRIDKFSDTVKQIELSPKRVEIDKFLKRYALLRKPSLPKKIMLNYESNVQQPVAMLDEDGMLSVLDNLLDNAVKAMGAKDTGSINITYNSCAVSLTRESEEILTDCVNIRFGDTGCGIKKEDIIKIFDLGFSTRQGLGLGLYKSLKIIESHGGKIEVESFKGEGTTFNIYLPVVQS